MNTADTVFRAILEKASSAGFVVTPLKLQKLAYYCQGYSLALNGKPCFSASIEAWEHGPVVRSEYGKYKSFGDGAIPAVALNAYQKLNSADKEIVDLIVAKYGCIDAWTLRNQTHRESPWMEAYAQGESNVISVEKIANYFAKTVDAEIVEECARLMNSMEDENIVQVPMSISSEDEFLKWLHS